MADTDAAVGNRDAHAVADTGGADPDVTAFGRELGGIGQQVAQHLDQTPGIGLDRQPRR